VFALHPICSGALFFIGGDKSGTYFHNHDNAYNALLFGSKRWWLLPPVATWGLASATTHAWARYVGMSCVTSHTPSCVLCALCVYCGQALHATMHFADFLLLLAAPKQPRSSCSRSNAHSTQGKCSTYPVCGHTRQSTWGALQLVLPSKWASTAPLNSSGTVHAAGVFGATERLA
jgi:hypothetical protein